MTRVLHRIPPVYDASSQTLILGSFPSVQSRAGAFYYHHPQNRFWRVLAAVYGCAPPLSIEDKRAMLLCRRVALWDVIASCDIQSSADSSIQNVVPNDLSIIFSAAKIERVFTNGAMAYKLYNKYCRFGASPAAACLPSTSPANAGYSLERLIERWSVISG